MYSDSPFPSLSYAARNPFPCGDGFAARIHFIDFSLMGYFFSSPSCDAL